MVSHLLAHISYIAAGLLMTTVPDGLPAPQDSVAREPRVIVLDPSAQSRSDIFHGPPETYTMRSGYMVLGPGESVGTHSTHDNEEAVIVLAGEGEMRIAGRPPMKLKAYSVAYCPPRTEHNVVNTGSDTLRYVWLVAKANR